MIGASQLAPPRHFDLSAMSPLGPKRTCRVDDLESAFGGNADLSQRGPSTSI
jgi:hypothetical protein